MYSTFWPTWKKERTRRQCPRNFLELRKFLDCGRLFTLIFNISIINQVILWTFWDKCLWKFQMPIKLVRGMIKTFSMSAFWTNALLESFQGQLGSEETTNCNYLEYEHKEIRKNIFSWFSMIGLLHDITWVFGMMHIFCQM